MSNEVEQIRAEVERRIKSWAAGIKYEGDAGNCQSRVTELTDLKKFIDSLPTKETPIEVCGKKVVVRYTRDGAPCEKCVFDGYTGCKYNHADCSRLDRVGMEIDERAYFVEAEQPQEKDYKKLYEELVNSEWYRKYYQGASVGDSVAVEQPEEEAPAREANPFVPDQGLTIDGKRYEKRYFRIGDACSRCAFKVGEDAKGHARCKDHGKPEKPCTPDRERGVLVYFIAANQLQEEIHSLQEWAKIMAERPDLRAEFDKMCPPQPVQGSIAPEADLEAEIERYYKENGWNYYVPYLSEFATIARYFAEWGAARLLAGAIKTDVFDIEDCSDAAKLIVRIPGAKTGDKVYIIAENTEAAPGAPLAFEHRILGRADISSCCD